MANGGVPIEDLKWLVEITIFKETIWHVANSDAEEIKKNYM